MIYKRGKVYWYKFMWQGEMIRESTRQGNDKVARQMEAAHRAALAKGLVGIREDKAVPTLAEFARERFLPWVEGTFRASPRTLEWYKNGVSRLCSFGEIAQAKLDEIRGELVASYAGHRRSNGLQVSSVNRELQVLRRILRLAVEWGVIERTVKVKMLPGERRCERVLLPEEEARYLAAAPDLLASVATVLVDTGMRPEECFRLRWETITWSNGRHGVLLVTHGKTAAARRVLPFTPRVRAVLESRWEAQGRPEEGWVWPSGTRSGHIQSCTLKKQHRKALRLSGVRPFVLYSLRHTFLTRLGESGCDAWTLARIAGHSSVAISARYVHPSEDAVMAAVERLGGHNSRHSQQTPQSGNGRDRQLTA
jgi:integrase